MCKLKRAVSLIKLIAVIVVLSTLSMLIIFNIKNIPENTQISLLHLNKSRVQRAVDEYLFNNKKLPVNNPENLYPGKPQQPNWTKLLPTYLREIPDDINIFHYWVDFQGKVWVSDIDAPTGVMIYDNFGNNFTTVTWNPVAGALQYEIGYYNENYEYFKIKTIDANKELKLDISENLDNKIIVVSSISERFKSVPVTEGYKETNQWKIKQVATGKNHTLLLLENGLVMACGNNQFGQLGLGFFGGNSINGYRHRYRHGYCHESDSIINFVIIPGLNNVKQIAAGDNFSLALLEYGTVMAWGSNIFGQLGLSNGYCKIPKPTIIPGLNNVKQITAGNFHSLALLEDGTVMAWGNNYFGQTGTGRNDLIIKSPTPVVNLNNVKQIAGGSFFSLALLENGTVMAWGNNYFGQLGNRTRIDENTPILIEGLNNVKQIATGRVHSIALLEDGTVVGWGNNCIGQIDSENLTSILTPTVINNLSNVEYIATGYWHNLTILSDKRIVSWGCNSHGQLGLGYINDICPPSIINNLNNVKKIAAGYNQSFAILKNGNLVAWGHNFGGKLGLKPRYGLKVSTPTLVPDFK